ncbi:uncharacterized protein STEHIDRAFT_119291 [Stereum hirsutum FP-91666 SS1]|uniref:uncharacterized protein n=1 Tax=Stereum hirsutum (strain FP-91666) TaxID=721885 RepID=UPI000440BB52|nr:uncharacterized protein STEHIDRAFT_119291 [Stereum hirsutum FP-91666 SS1]EIM90249.1 hypothetical protein STEHIDRAFT_119291 [Stereum hirsutum FP-91666 SS1]
MLLYTAYHTDQNSAPPSSTEATYKSTRPIDSDTQASSLRPYETRGCFEGRLRCLSADNDAQPIAELSESVDYIQAVRGKCNEYRGSRCASLHEKRRKEHRRTGRIRRDEARRCLKIRSESTGVAR